MFSSFLYLVPLICIYIENILCGEELDDIKIADFGLSKMILPTEMMDSACGTLSYVAPEVLTMQGYGMEADLWSVGVIMFLFLCGKLPFNGDDHEEIIRCTIAADIKVEPKFWATLSDESKDLITSLLQKCPKDRITARRALKHPFLQLYKPQHRHHHHHHHHRHHSNTPSNNSSGESTSTTVKPPPLSPSSTRYI
jgi:serine/threonine protein kinase